MINEKNEENNELTIPFTISLVDNVDGITVLANKEFFKEASHEQVMKICEKITTDLDIYYATQKKE